MNSALHIYEREFLFEFCKISFSFLIHIFPQYCYLHIIEWVQKPLSNIRASLCACADIIHPTRIIEIFFNWTLSDDCLQAQLRCSIVICVYLLRPSIFKRFYLKNILKIKQFVKLPLIY